MADPINVVITGDQSQLAQSLSLAKARLAELNTALTQTSQKMIEMGNNASAQLKAKFVDLTNATLETRVEVANLSSALTESVKSTNDAADGHGKLQLATAGSTREFIVLGHEALSGNFSRIPGSIMVLAERMGGLQTIIAGLASPLGALVVAFGAAAAAATYLTVEAIKASNALGQIAINAQLLGNSDATKTAITGIATEVAKLGNISKSTATTYVGAVSEMKNSTNATIEDMAVVATLWAAATGKNVTDVSAQFKKYATELPTDLEKVVSAMGGSTAAQIEQAREIEKTGDKYAAVALLMDVMTAAIVKNKDAIVEQRSSLGENIWSSFANVVGETSGQFSGLDGQMTITDLIMKATGQTIDQLIEKQHKLNTEVASAPKPQQETIAQADKAADSQGGTQKQIADQTRLNSIIEQGIIAQNKMVAALRETGDAKGLDDAIAESNRLNAALEEGQHKLAALDFGDYVQNADAAVKKTESTWNAAHSDMYATAAKSYRDAANSFGASEADKRALEKKADEADLQAKNALGTELVEQNRATIAKINADESLSATQRLSATRAIYQAESNDARLSYDQRLAAERQVSQSTIQLRNTTNQQTLKALQDTTQETVKGSAERVAAAQAEVAFTTRIYKAGSDQVIEAQHHLTEAIKEQVDTWVGDYERGIKQTLESTKLNEQQKLEIIRQAIQSIGAENSQNKTLLDRLRQDEVAQEKKASTEKIAIARDEATEKIAIAKSVQQNAAAQLDIDVELGRKTYTQKFAALQQYENQVYAVERAALVQELANQTAGTAGALKSYKAIEDADRTHQNTLLAITRQSIQEQIQSYQQLATAIVGPVGNAVDGLITKTMTLQQAVQSIFQSMVSYIIQQIELWVEKWLVSLVMGDAANTTSNQAKIASDAAVSAAGAYSAIALIPYVGPALAPEAAATAYAGTMAYSAAASLDVGAWNVPKDMPANIHQGEMVVPATFAQGLRGGGSIGGGGDTYNINLSAVDNRGMKQLLMDHGPTLIKSLQNQKRNLNGGS